jgi:uncharacterized protein YjlB
MIVDPKTSRLAPDGSLANNPRLPLLLYPQAVALNDKAPATVFETRFQIHRWGATRCNGVFTFHQYHSTAHEVPGVYRGKPICV